MFHLQRWQIILYVLALENVFIYRSDHNVAALWLLCNNDYEKSLDLIRVSLIYDDTLGIDRSQSLYID